MTQTSAIRALRAAAPYLRLYRGKTFVIKTDAQAPDAGVLKSVIEQIAILHHLGIRIVLIHGANSAFRLPQLRELLGSSVLESCRELGIDVVGPPQGSIGLEELRTQLKVGSVPVLDPMPGADADAFAATIAGKLMAEKLLFCGLAAGILEQPDEPRSLISYLDLEGLHRLERAGALEGQRMPSAAAIRAALKGGVKRVHVISQNAPDSILIEIFTNEGGGTLIVADVKALTPAELQPLPVAS